jgi:hypothetical protein
MRTAITHIYERVGQEEVTIADNALAGTFTFKKSGVLKGIAWESSDYASQATFTISIKDAEDTVLYTSGALAHDSAAYIPSLDVILVDETHTVTVTTGDPGVGGAVIGVTLLIMR